MFAAFDAWYFALPWWGKVLVILGTSAAVLVGSILVEWWQKRKQR